jgi:MIP family channel proteins
MAGRRPRGELAGALAAELIGTYLLVFLGAGTVLATKLLLAPDAPLDATAIALAFGFAVVVAVYALGHVSGAHINPSVTVGLAAVRRFPWRAVPAYVSVQLAGALLASLTHWALFGDRARDQLFLGATTPGPRGTAIAFLAEVVITFFLVLTIVATAVDKRSPGPLAAGVAIGLVVSVGIFATLPASGRCSSQPSSPAGGRISPARLPEVSSAHWPTNSSSSAVAHRTRKLRLNSLWTYDSSAHTSVLRRRTDGVCSSTGSGHAASPANRRVLTSGRASSHRAASSASGSATSQLDSRSFAAATRPSWRRKGRN